MSSCDCAVVRDIAADGSGRPVCATIAVCVLRSASFAREVCELERHQRYNGGTV